MTLQKPNIMSPPLIPPQQDPSGQVERRTVSGTPILPPVENLRPSPEQLKNMSSNEPVPTPSKQPQAAPQVLTGVEDGVHIKNNPEQPGAVQSHATENQQVTTGVETTTT